MSPLRGRRRQPGEACGCLRPIIRIFGLLTSFVICGVGVDVLLHSYNAGLFIILAALIVFVLETKWIVTLFLDLLLPNHGQNGCLRYWRGFCKFFGSWSPAPFYVAVGVALILWAHNLWLSPVAGCLLILLALLRLCLLLRFSRNAKEEGLLPQCDFEKMQICAEIPEQHYVEISCTLEQEPPINDIDFMINQLQPDEVECDETDACL